MSMNESDTCSQYQFWLRVTAPVGLSISCPAILGPWTLTHMLIRRRQLNVTNLLWNFRFLLSSGHLPAFAYTEDFFLFCFHKTDLCYQRVFFFFLFVICIFNFKSNYILCLENSPGSEVAVERSILVMLPFPHSFSSSAVPLKTSLESRKKKKNPFSGYCRLTSE